MHQGPMPQAKAKGGRKPPPHRSYGHPFHPHNLGSYLLVYATPLRTSIHPLVPQHEIIDAIRLYFAYHASQTDSGADQYYVNVTSMLSIMKTSVYLAETVVSDLFIVSLSIRFLSTRHTDPDHAISYIGAISFGTRVSQSSLSPSFYTSPT